MAKTPGLPSVGTRVTCWNPASLARSIISVHPSSAARFSAAMEGRRIHSWRRATPSAWRFTISAWMASTSAPRLSEVLAERRILGNASVAAEAAVAPRSSRRVIGLMAWSLPHRGDDRLLELEGAVLDADLVLVESHLGVRAGQGHDRVGMVVDRPVGAELRAGDDLRQLRLALRQGQAGRGGVGVVPDQHRDRPGADAAAVGQAHVRLVDVQVVLVPPE